MPVYDAPVQQHCKCKHLSPLAFAHLGQAGSPNSNTARHFGHITNAGSYMSDVLTIGGVCTYMAAHSREIA